jgi:hypothetical protein
VGGRHRKTFCFYLIITACFPFIIKDTERRKKGREGEVGNLGEGKQSGSINKRSHSLKGYLLCGPKNLPSVS